MARTPIHPGEILADELEEINLTAKKLAEVIQVPPNRLYQILAGKPLLFKGEDFKKTDIPSAL